MRQVELTEMSTIPNLFAPVRLEHLGGATSEGKVIGAQGRANEALHIGFESGPFKGKRFVLECAYKDLSIPVEIPMVGTIVAPALAHSESVQTPFTGSVERKP